MPHRHNIFSISQRYRFNNMYSICLRIILMFPCWMVQSEQSRASNPKFQGYSKLLSRIVTTHLDPRFSKLLRLGAPAFMHSCLRAFCPAQVSRVNNWKDGSILQIRISIKGYDIMIYSRRSFLLPVMRRLSACATSWRSGFTSVVNTIPGRSRLVPDTASSTTNNASRRRWYERSLNLHQQLSRSTIASVYLSKLVDWHRIKLQFSF